MRYVYNCHWLRWLPGDWAATTIFFLVLVAGVALTARQKAEEAEHGRQWLRCAILGVAVTGLGTMLWHWPPWVMALAPVAFLPCYGLASVLAIVAAGWAYRENAFEAAAKRKALEVLHV